MTIQGGALVGNREGTLPTTGFRGVNGTYTADEGVLDPINDPLFIAGGDLDVDRFLVATGGPDVRSARERMKLKHLSHRAAHAIFKGSNASDPKEFNGLQVRCVDTQLIDAGSTSGGDALSIAKLDATIAAVPDCNALAMSTQMATLLSTAAKSTSLAGTVTFKPTEFGLRMRHYNEIPIIEIGQPNHVYSTLSFSEANPGGGSSVGTSIYALRFAEDGVAAIQHSDPMVDDLGMLDSGAIFRTRFEWYFGLTVGDKFSLARLRGIKNAAVVA